jgi:hypothetical protein
MWAGRFLNNNYIHIHIQCPAASRAGHTPTCPTDEMCLNIVDEVVFIEAAKSNFRIELKGQYQNCH